MVLISLAAHLVALRAARKGEPEHQKRLGQVAREIYAPLASRLGIWQLKWELEDLAFRFLEPDVYKRIAQALKETRSARQARQRITTRYGQIRG